MTFFADIVLQLSFALAVGAVSAKGLSSIITSWNTKKIVLPWRSYARENSAWRILTLAVLFGIIILVPSARMTEFSLIDGSVMVVLGFLGCAWFCDALTYPKKEWGRIVVGLAALLGVLAIVFGTGSVVTLGASVASSALMVRIGLGVLFALLLLAHAGSIKEEEGDRHVVLNVVLGMFFVFLLFPQSGLFAEVWSGSWLALITQMAVFWAKVLAVLLGTHVVALLVQRAARGRLIPFFLAFTVLLGLLCAVEVFLPSLLHTIL